jgi:DNA-binding CsgD family transcriptional regulator
VQAALGKTAEARACLDELERLLEAVPAGTAPTGEPLGYLTATALALGDRERLVRLRPRLLPFEGSYADFLFDRLIGQIDALAGDRVAAERRLAAAEAIARREGMVWDLAAALETRARLALTGDRAAARRADALLAEAAGLVERGGNGPEARRLEALRRQLAPGAGRPTLPASLSAREAEVLRLVAAGLTNRAIADQLSLSEKTVENHLTSVYGKIGADTRAAAVAFAFRHGLA